MNKSAKISVIVMVGLFNFALAAICFAGPPVLPMDQNGTTQRDIQWLNDSPLTVYEQITDRGDGVYEYRYSFENVDDANLWHFGVYTTFVVDSSPTTWDTHPLWFTYVHDDLDTVFPVYDGRNLDSDIVALTVTGGPDWPNTTDPIVPGETVDGFTYVATTYDNNPKYYFYETVEIGYAGETGYVAAVGQTKGWVATMPATWSDIKTLYR